MEDKIRSFVIDLCKAYDKGEVSKSSIEAINAFVADLNFRERIKDDNRIWSEGFGDGYKNDSFESCKYEIESENFYSWRRGWIDGQEALKARKIKELS